MKSYSFQLGKNGGAIFSIGEDGLKLAVNENGEEYILSFADEVKTDRHFYDQSAYCKNIVIPTFSENSIAEKCENTLKITTEISPKITVINLFTVCTNQSSILLETYFETKEKLYDTSAFVSRFRMDADSFSEVGGGDINAFLDYKNDNPNYAFSNTMILKGENKYFKITGGYVSIFRGTVNPHTFLENFNDDLSHFSKNNPLKTAFTFEETDMPLPFSNHSKEEDAKSNGKIISGDYTVEYKISENGTAFVFENEEKPMVTFLLRNVKTGENIYCDTVSGWEKVNVFEENNKTVFEFENPFNIKEFKLILTAEVIPEKSRIEWSVETLNNTTYYTLMWCSYPRMYYASSKKCDLFFPSHGGALHKNFNQTDAFYAGGYPSGFHYPMPYYAIYPSDAKKDGRYFAIHDATGAFKDLYAASDANGCVRLSCRFSAQNYGEAGNSQCLPGKAVWQYLNGDWFDATEIYREFVENNCDWYPKSNENGRENIPMWMRDLPFWIMDWMPNESDSEEEIPVSLRTNIGEINENSWFENPVKLRKELGVPIGYHLYNWHKIPFNNDFPHFLPPKNALKDGLDKLKKADIRIMPYINALLWDNKDKGNEDFEFTKKAFCEAVKNEKGEQHILMYASHEADGERVKLSPMCPSGKMWRETLKNLVAALFNDYGFDAVYLDQIGARVPHLCMDKSHGHVTGGGSWWQKNYRELLSELGSVKPKDGALTTEANAEVYANDIDGFLSWAWIATTNYVPAFMRIYGGKTSVLGRNANGYMKENVTYWKYHLALSLISGEQLGWINSDFVNDKNRLSFAKKLIRFRYENKEFFRSARPMRPPVVEADASHKFLSAIGMNHQGVLYQPYMLCGILENGNKRKMIIINIAETCMSDVISFKADEILLKKDNYTILGDGKIEFIEHNKIKAEMPKDGLLVLSWEA